MSGSWRLAHSFGRVHAMNELQYRANFFLQIGVSISQVAGALVSVQLVFSRVDSLNGWSHDQLLTFIGVYTLLGGITRAFVEPAMTRLLGDIRSGELDLVLVKPASTQLLVSFRAISVWALLDVVIGVVIATIGITRLHATMNVGDLALFIGMLCCAVLILRSIWLVLGAAGFWFVKLDFIDAIYVGAFRASQYPIGIYPRWLEIGLTAVLPTGLAVTAPAEAITGQLGVGRLVAALVVGMLAVVGSSALFRAGVRRYSSASS